MTKRDDRWDATVKEMDPDGALNRTQRELVTSLLASVHDLAQPSTDLLDLKIADTALAEMAEAFALFRQYRPIQKLTMFGSARTLPDDPVYLLAKDLAASLAAQGWMVVTGAGPGIMQAGAEGAGRENSMGVNIRLPMEQGANPFIDKDSKLVEMRYFFTRKLILGKESDAYAALPGGFGTLDEVFELLTLIQTGKAQPAPIVLVETDGGTYWHRWSQFVVTETIEKNYVSSEDTSLYRVVNSVDEAMDEINTFYRNYQSSRFVGDLLVMRVLTVPSRAELDDLNRRFGDLLVAGVIRTSDPLPPEVLTNDALHLGRVTLRFNRLTYGRLRQFIDALNECTGA